jgi:AcrR family transcriptional regulator
MSEAGHNSAKEERRKEILDVAFAEFAAKGYAGASMAAIARRAQASKETLYAWFENKETLFNTVFESRLAGMVSRVSGVAAKEPSPAAVLPVVAEDVIRFMLAIAPLNQARGVGDPSEKALRLVGQTIAEERGRFVDYLLRCRDQGLVAFDDDPFELVSLFVAMAEGEWTLRLATGQIDALTDEMIAAHARRVTRIFLKGIAP